MKMCVCVLCVNDDSSGDDDDCIQDEEEMTEMLENMKSIT